MFMLSLLIQASSRPEFLVKSDKLWFLFNNIMKFEQSVHHVWVRGAGD